MELLQAETEIEDVLNTNEVKQEPVEEKEEDFTEQMISFYNNKFKDKSLFKSLLDYLLIDDTFSYIFLSKIYEKLTHGKVEAKTFITLLIVIKIKKEIEVIEDWPGLELIDVLEERETKAKMKSEALETWDNIIKRILSE